MTGAVVVASMYEILNASASPSSATGGPGLSPQITNSVTVTAHGGSGSYTYAWAYTSGDTFNVTSPTSATTTFSKGGATGMYNGVQTCTVTDAAGFSVPVAVNVQVELS
jgi:hypothetical protein